MLTFERLPRNPTCAELHFNGIAFPFFSARKAHRPCRRSVSATSRRAADSRSRRSPGLATARSSFFARSFSSFRAHAGRCTGATRCNVFAMSGMRRHYACAPHPLLRTDEQPDPLCPSTTTSRSSAGTWARPAARFSVSLSLFPFPSFFRSFSFSFPAAKTPKFLIRDAHAREMHRRRRRRRCCNARHLFYLTLPGLHCCSPVINLVRHIPRYAKNSEHQSLSRRLGTIG